MKVAKKITLFLNIIILSLSAYQANAHVNLSDNEIANFRFDIVRSFHVLDRSTGKEKRIRPRKNTRLRILGEKGWAYVVQLEVDGVIQPKQYFAAKKWVKKAVNRQVVHDVRTLNQTIQTITDPPAVNCIQRPIPRPRPRPWNSNVSSFNPVDPTSVIAEKPQITRSQKEWKKGCEVLANLENLTIEKDFKALDTCIQSIQHTVTNSGRNMNRDTVFKNLYKYLRPEEQKFAALMFTVQGEVGFLAAGNPPKLQEMQAVMKVMENRVRNSNKFKRRGKKKTINELDVALDPWQFSMYNYNSRNWRNVINPGTNQNFSNAIKSFIKYQKADFRPKPDVDHIYHYHANYVLPGSWGRYFKRNHKSLEVPLTVDGESLRQAPAGYDEGSASDRRRIGRNLRLVRHRFYRPIDTRGRIYSSRDNWYWTVRTPWKN